MEEAKKDTNWMSHIEGFLLDITGVLYNSGPNGGRAIDGSVEAVKRSNYFMRFLRYFSLNLNPAIYDGRIEFRLYADGHPVRFVSNESTSTREALVSRLRRLGFSALSVEDVLTPAPL